MGNAASWEELYNNYETLTNLVKAGSDVAGARTAMPNGCMEQTVTDMFAANRHRQSLGFEAARTLTEAIKQHPDGELAGYILSEAQERLDHPFSGTTEKTISRESDGSFRVVVKNTSATETIVYQPLIVRDLSAETPQNADGSLPAITISPGEKGEFSINVAEDANGNPVPEGYDVGSVSDIPSLQALLIDNIKPESTERALASIVLGNEQPWDSTIQITTGRPRSFVSTNLDEKFNLAVEPGDKETASSELSVDHSLGWAVLSITEHGSSDVDLLEGMYQQLKEAHPGQIERLDRPESEGYFFKVRGQEAVDGIVNSIDANYGADGKGRIELFIQHENGYSGQYMTGPNEPPPANVTPPTLLP